MTAGLEALQRRFHGLVTSGAPLGVADDDADFVGTAGLPAAARVQIYADMYLVRLLDTLADQFPRLLAALGRGAFADVSRGYLAAHPPTSPSLRELGQRLPAHLAAVAEDRPHLAELAALEWAELDLFDGPDGRPLALAEVQALDPEALAGLALALNPTARLLALAHDVAGWAPEPDGVPPAAAAPTLVFRAGFEVRARLPAPDEAAALALVATGTTIGALCEHLGDAGVVFGLLGRWLEEELLEAPGAA